MVAGKTDVITNAKDLNELFNHKADTTAIIQNFQMPKIGQKAKTVTIIPAVGKDGCVAPAFKSTHPNLNGGIPVAGMYVEEVGNEGTIYKITLGESLKRGFDAICNDNKLTFMDLIGKIINISAAPFKGTEAKNRCKVIGCKGISGGGCVECGGTGYSTVFGVTLRRDLMSPSKASAKIQDQF